MELGQKLPLQGNTILDLVTTVYQEGVNIGTVHAKGIMTITTAVIIMKLKNNDMKTTIQDQVMQKQCQIIVILSTDHVIVTVVGSVISTRRSRGK
jgi:hypothetical protein